MSLEDELREFVRREARAVFEEMFAEREAGDDEWLSVSQAAEMTQLSEWTIRQLARKGLLEKYQPNPGRPPLRIRRSAIRALMSKGGKK